MKYDLGEAGLEAVPQVAPENNVVVGERSEHANSDLAAGVVTCRRYSFTGRVDDQCRYLLAKFRPQEVPWVPRGSGPSSYPKRPFPYRISLSLAAQSNHLPGQKCLPCQRVRSAACF